MKVNRADKSQACIRLPKDLKRLVSVEAARREMSKSALVEMAIRKYFKVSRTTATATRAAA